MAFLFYVRVLFGRNGDFDNDSNFFANHLPHLFISKWSTHSGHGTKTIQ